MHDPERLLTRYHMRGPLSDAEYVAMRVALELAGFNLVEAAGTTPHYRVVSIPGTGIRWGRTFDGVPAEHLCLEEFFWEESE